MGCAEPECTAEGLRVSGLGICGGGCWPSTGTLHSDLSAGSRTHLQVVFPSTLSSLFAYLSTQHKEMLSKCF